MTFTDAAAEVLRLVGRPLHYKEITDIAIEKNLLSHVGKSPEVTMGARLAATLKKDSPENPLVRVKPGVFALREWDEKTIKAGLDGKKGKKPAKEAPVKGRGKDAEDEGAVDVDVDDDGAAEINGEPVAIDDDGGFPEDMIAMESDAGVALAAAPSGAGFEEEEDRGPPGPDEAMRAEAAAGAAEMFDEEDDDDQPIFGAPEERSPTSSEPTAEGRRRRRRRRRGRGSLDANGSVVGGDRDVHRDREPHRDRDRDRDRVGGGGLPTYTATPAFESRRDTRGDGEAMLRGPQVIELTGGDGHALDDLAGRDLADGIAAILSTFDRNAGAVSLRQIAETAQRRGRLVGDAQLAQSHVAAAVRADNARRIAAGQRPRFRFAGGRVALTDWLLSGDLARLEQEAIAAVERYRDAARRAFARKLSELPGHAFVELCVLALERIGMGQLRAVRRAGAPGGETHFAGVLRGAADELKVAIVIRRDGREVGRERVTELRGALHHYGPAAAGWIFTSGQTLSGAREEAGIPGTAPIALYDGLAVARLCEDNDVAVLRAKMPIAIPDVDLLEALRAS